nr:cadherin-like beta sandwich domain-containing protein [Lachnospiraceae bacterium]
PVQTETVSELKGVVQGTNVNVRKKAVTGTVIGSVSTGAEVTVKKNETGSDGKVWYYISTQITGSLKEGWIRSDFVKITQTEQADSKENESGTANTENEDSAGTKEEPVQEIKKGNLKGNYVRARQKPVNGTMICYLMAGAELVIEGEEKGSDGYTWYKVAFQYNGVAKSGYVRSDFVELQVQQSTGENAQEEVLSDEDFEAYLNAQGFPKSYKNSLRNLHNIHPEWEFRAVKTGLDWNDAITAESKVGTNLVTKAAIASWKSTEKTAYNWKTNSWYTFDGGAWVAASKDIVSYYMDPRNFLTETTVFQFESLEYEPYQNKQGVKRLLKGSFMSGSYKEPDGKKRSYANTFVKAGKAVGVSPYHLAARCYQEQGTGKSGSISGTVSGYENTFNYYNIGAYAQGGNSPVVQGLIYASSSTSKNTNYDRPWNTRYKSIMGGAQYVAQKYVKVGQNTLYFQKFNVVNKKNGLYRHQYMTNIQAAEAEAVKMSKAYTAEDKQLAFYIPVYENMPDAPSAKPVSNANPNNYLASLEIADQQLTPVFDPEVTEYDLTVPKKVKKVKIQATAVAGTSTVTGTGKVKLARGENVFTVICKAENGVEKTYTIHIVRE